jgi:molybdopterin synthase catalytic subunit
LIVRVQTDPIDPAALLARLEAGGAGGVVSFTGVVRGGRGEEVVSALEIEAYPGFTERQIEREARGVAEDLVDLVVVHRTGRIGVGEPVVFVAAAAEHRRAAFEAVDRMMDYLKSAAPLWKREHGSFGARWIEPHARDLADAARWRPLGACA